MCIVELRKCYEKCTRNWYFDSVKWKSIKYQFCTLQDNYNLLIKKLNLFHTGQKTTMMKLVFSFRKFIFFWTNLCCHISGLDHTRCILLRLVIRATLLNILRFLQLLFLDFGLFIKVLCKKGNKIELFEKFQKISNLTKNVKCDGATSLSAFELGFINYLNF